MRLREIEQLDVDFLSVAQVASCIRCDPQLIRDEAGKDPKCLGFPITKVGHSWKIPKEGFVNWARWMIRAVQIVNNGELLRSVEQDGL